jgi:fumarylacetoacetase
MVALNKTHDPSRKSWVTTANSADSPFPIQNLPYGVFSIQGGQKRIGVAIGDSILDLTTLEATERLEPVPGQQVFQTGNLNAFMATPQPVWSRTRATIADILDVDSGDRDAPLVDISEATLHLPIFVRSFTDFYASREHATNVGSMFRDPDNALMPNWPHIPIGYNGRASTVVVSGTPIRRPNGQLKSPNEDTPRFGPCAKLDIELELGARHTGLGVSATRALPVQSLRNLHQPVGRNTRGT